MQLRCRMRWCRIWCCLALLLIAGPATAAESPAQFRAGTAQVVYTDPATGTPVPVLLTYPTRDPVQPIRRGPYHINVAPEGTPALHPMPLALISQGPSRNSNAMIGIALFLARRGMMTATVTHMGSQDDPAGNTGIGDTRIGTRPLWPELPTQLRSALDAVLDSPAMGWRVDRDRIGAIGFGPGGYAALVEAGAVADLGRIPAHCARHPDNRALCPAEARTAAAALPAPPKDAADSRIRALVLMDPVGALFGDGALSRVAAPVRLYAAEKGDEGGALEVGRVRSLLPGSPEVQVVPGAGHYAYFTPVPPSAAARVGVTAQDPPGFDRAAFHERLNDEVLDFFRRTLTPVR